MTDIKFENEILIQKFWEQKKIYEKVKEKNKGSKPFNFIEGPPFPTGDAHLGHLRNWAIKDTVLRFKRSQGYEVYARDGYDVQGLPVENKVQKRLALKTTEDLRKFGVDNFINECRKYVSEIIDDMKGVRARFGFWIDSNQYQTSHPNYISMAWKFFEKAKDKGLLYKDYKTVAWCPLDETTLSDYEIKDTYKVIEDPSIYVKFPIKEEFKTTNYPESFLIWTTTPWTLQSNMAIAVHPEFDYAKALVEINGKEEVLIIAKSLVKSVLKVLSKSIDIKFKKIAETIKGAELEGVKYEHIYLDETPSQKEFAQNGHKHVHSAILADFVTLGEGEDIFEKLEKRGYKHSNKDEDSIEEAQSQSKGKSEGTGLVHIAPGHGFDDYEVGKRYNLPIFCPVDKSGLFNEGKYEGKYFKDVDPIAIDYLKKKGFLLHFEKKSHRYPCCWRCKTPIVYRAADQWWIKRAEYAQKIVKENSNVKWYPESAKTSFNNLMNSAGDWAISRQRFWGTPMPIWEDEDGNYEVFGSKEELEKRISKKLKDVHLDDLRDIKIKNKDSGKEMSHVGLTADVWFDSGCASFASHYDEGLSFDEIIKKYYPIHWITESEDQIRGWFSSLFNVGYVVTEKAPYNQVLFYRFVMDKDGVKMSKSLGNGIDGTEAIENWGSDRTRYYLLTKRAPEDQINFDPEEFSLVNGFFNTLENVFKFSNAYLAEHEIRHTAMNTQTLDAIDLWILYRLNDTIGRFTRHIENFRLNQGLKEIEEFIINDFSKIYLKLVKDRTEERDEDLIIILNEILKKVLITLSSAIPFKAEELYQASNILSKKESIFLENLPDENAHLVKEVKSKEIDKNFDLAQDIIAAVLNAREKAKIGVRWPLGQIDIISSDDNISQKLKIFEPLIKKLTNVSKINYDIGDVDINYIIKPNFATLKIDFKNPADAIKAINMSKFYIAQDLKKGLSSGKYEGVQINFDKHIIKEIELKGELSASDFSKGNVILHTHQDEILLEEGYLRELMRRVQSYRKDLGLNKKDKIKLSFEGSDDYFHELVSNWANVISKKTGAEDILQNSLENKKEYDIKGKKLVVSIEKIE